MGGGGEWPPMGDMVMVAWCVAVVAGWAGAVATLLIGHRSADSTRMLEQGLLVFYQGCFNH